MKKLISNENFTKKKKIMDDYSNSIYSFDFNREAKIGEMNKVLNTASQQYLGRIENRRNNTILNYKKERNNQYNSIIENHKDYWIKKNPKYLLPDEEFR